MFDEDALFPQLVGAGYLTSMVGKIHNDQKRWLCEASNRTELFRHISSTCHPCGTYYPTELVVKGLNDSTTRVVGVERGEYSHGIWGNASVAFIREAVALQHPFFAHIGVTGPHLPAIPAPWHAHLVDEWERTAARCAPRTPTFNEVQARDHPLVAGLPEIAAADTWALDRLHRDRLATLASVDDLVAGVYEALRACGALENTYVIVTSDHGYHIGQRRLPMEKMWPYETDMRIPFWMRGPDVAPKTAIGVLAVNIDVAPTVLDLANVPVPNRMDGMSLAPIVFGDTTLWPRPASDRRPRRASRGVKRRGPRGPSRTHRWS